MICRLCLNTLDEQSAVLLFAAADSECSDNNKAIPENYLVHLISTHLYLCLSRDDAISTSICTDCCAQLESFHNFWKLVEHKQTTLCSQFLEIDCDVNWAEDGEGEGDADFVQTLGLIDFKQEPDPDLETEHEAGGGGTPTGYDVLVKEETEFHDSYLKSDPKAAAAAHKFPCMFCEKSFKMRRYLEEHVATHTGDRPIACAYCNTAFRCRSNMYTHVKTKHTTQWQKARAERDAAKVNSNNNIQIQRGVNGDSDKFVDAVAVPSAEPEASEQQQQLPVQPPLIKIPVPPAPTLQPPTPTAAPAAPPTPAPLPAPAITCHEVLPPAVMSTIKSECGEAEAINLTVNKACAGPAKRITRASRRKTHSPKKVQHTTRSASASEDSSSEDVADLFGKRFKTELQTCKENELILANYANLQQQQHQLLQLEQQHQQEQLLSAVSTSTAAAAAAAAAALALSSQSSVPAAAAASPAPTPALTAEAAYACSVCGQQLRNQRALNNHLHNKHNVAVTAMSSPTLATVSICSSCGELAASNHRCLSKAKYTCDVCGKSFKMKRYLEEHFATHTGVKLHTCSFCPTEFRSKSNMYHHTKRKHKLEWERSRASRNAAKQQQEQHPQHKQQHPNPPHPQHLQHPQQHPQQEAPSTNS
ncbi:hypothetical protein KR222_011382 [Zaprionus bogoriensis]|nr:hypothetical protein KR222_011382 [Zaprionus bogoriensis]